MVTIGGVLIGRAEVDTRTESVAKLLGVTGVSETGAWLIIEKKEVLADKLGLSLRSPAEELTVGCEVTLELTGEPKLE